MYPKNTYFEAALASLRRSPQAMLWLTLLSCLTLGTHARAQSEATQVNSAKDKKNVEPTQLASLDLGNNLGFNTAFLHGNASASDLHAMLAGPGVLEGVQRVDFYVNQERASRRDITFKYNPRTDKVDACFNLEIFEQIGIDLSKLPEVPEANNCLRLLDWVPQSSESYDINRLRLQISVPQIYLNATRRGYADPSLWDNGQTAAFVTYSLNGRRDQHKGAQAHSQLNTDLRLGINLGSWRLRNNSYLSSGTGRSTSFKSQNTYAQRDIASLSSQLVAGQTYTRSPLFNSVRFLGVQMMSDDAMRPDSEQGYAPIIRGTAESNATVEVRQNGYVIYTTTVAPGPFAITDLTPSGSNGDLEIDIIEADGSRRSLRQSFSSPPLMVREGRVKYDISAGQVQLNHQLRERPIFVSGSLLYGVSTNATLAAGLQTSHGFNAYSLGVGLNTPLGGVSLDGTRSSSRVHGYQSQGTSMNLRYAKFIEQTDSNISINLQRNLNQGYRDLSEHVTARDTLENRFLYGQQATKQRLDASLSQALLKGNLYLNASYNKYWDDSASNSLSLGYSNNIGKLNYNLAYTHTRNLRPYHDQSRRNDNIVMLTLSMPLGSGAYAPQGFANLNRERSGTAVQVGASGLLPTEREISYGVSAGRTTTRDTNGSITIGTSTSFARLNAGYTYGSDYNSGNLSASGSIVAHSGGLNLGQSLGETVMLAKVEPAIAGVGITSHAGVKTGSNGYAIIPDATPYRNNHVSLDTRQAPRNAEFDNAVQQTVPTRGAIALVKFQAQLGQRVQFELHDEQGTTLAFGAMVQSADGEQLGMTDPRGRILTMVTPENQKGHLDVSRDGSLCRATYALPEQSEESNYQFLRVKCIERPADPIQPGHLVQQTRPKADSV